MIGIYLSGTGNTEHCLRKLMGLTDESAELLPLNAADEDSIISSIAAHDTVYLAYPTQFSNAPYMVRDMIERNQEIWSGKKVFCLVTMGLFSGDGTGCCARLLKKYGAQILGGLQIVMPDSIGDNKMLKKSDSENRRILCEADKRIESAAADIRNGKYPQEGLGFAAHMAGLFGQRLWFYGKTADYSAKLKISDSCAGCGVCVSECPMSNLSIKDGKAVPAGKCAMCYRCISLCPKQAITLLGKQIYTQYRYDKYADTL